MTLITVHGLSFGLTVTDWSCTASATRAEDKLREELHALSAEDAHQLHHDLNAWCEATRGWARHPETGHTIAISAE